MSLDQQIFVALMAALAAFALAGAFAASRALSRAGAGLRQADARLHAIAHALPNRADDVRDQLADIDAQADNMLGILESFDERVDKATADLRAKRLASDTLRLRLIEGRLTIARIRQLVRLLMRLGELRRVVL